VINPNIDLPNRKDRWHGNDGDRENKTEKERQCVLKELGVTNLYEWKNPDSMFL